MACELTRSPRTSARKILTIPGATALGAIVLTDAASKRCTRTMKNYDCPDARPYSNASLTELLTSWAMAGGFIIFMTAVCWPVA